MKVLVTGATGFVGANVAMRLLREGHEVHAPVRAESNKWRIAEVENELNLHEVDLRDFLAVKKMVEEIKPEIIMHLATYGAYPTRQTEFEKIFETNYFGTANLVRACDSVEYECFINTSSSSEYGLTDKKMAEGDLPKPVNYYGATKTAATVFCQTHARISGKPIITTRLFSVYGPWEEPSRLVPLALKSCIKGEKLALGDGKTKRDFIYTVDVENAYLELMTRADLTGEILNIGTGTQYAVREMVEMIAKKSGADSALLEWGKLPTRNLEAENWVADMRKAHRILKWRAKESLESGVEKSVEWMRKNLQYY